MANYGLHMAGIEKGEAQDREACGVLLTAPLSEEAFVEVARNLYRRVHEKGLLEGVGEYDVRLLTGWATRLTAEHR